MKTAKEKLESENSKLKDEIAEMIRVNEAIFESGSKLDIRPEDLPNRFSKLLPVYFQFQGWRVIGYYYLGNSAHKSLVSDSPVHAHLSLIIIK